jgi:hypothetical protein
MTDFGLTTQVRAMSVAGGAVPLGSTAAAAPRADDAELRRTFDQVVGELLFRQTLQAMRKTLGKPAYFHGGRAEEIFTERLDLELAQKLTEASAHQLTGPMYELFTLRRQ